MQSNAVGQKEEVEMSEQKEGVVVKPPTMESLEPGDTVTVTIPVHVISTGLVKSGPNAGKPRAFVARYPLRKDDKTGFLRDSFSLFSTDGPHIVSVETHSGGGFRKVELSDEEWAAIPAALQSKLAKFRK